jgi:lipid II:glycine glycyltransferase (peptidoglycan interpeptide bridge formation enzyme)
VIFKSFIEICKAYSLNQDSKDIKIEDHTLDLEVIRIEQHISKVTTVKKKAQELPEYKSDLTIIKEETQLEQAKEQESIVQVRRSPTDQLYN